MLRAAVVVVSIALIAIGTFLICSAATSSTPDDLPKPTDSEPAGSHICLSPTNDPSWCEDI
ncbi:hypothetical protein [Streptomyces sp. NPDC056192]|uniref:hypothetical protein n=1 Tax=Streptomyces sp. NPDC056192 TaxID=3345743 RepID=UPI0035E137D3